MYYFMKLFLVCTVLAFNTSVEASGKKGVDKEKVEEENEKPKKTYKNPFESYQKQRTNAELLKAKAVQKATVNAGVKSKRNPNNSSSVKMYSKKIKTLNDKIQKKYVAMIKSYGARIPKHMDKIKELNDRLKMTSSTESTMEKLSKYQLELEEMKEKFIARVVTFEPIPENLLKDEYKKLYPWLKDVAE